MLFFYIKALMYITVTYKEMENEKFYFETLPSALTLQFCDGSKTCNFPV